MVNITILRKSIGFSANFINSEEKMRKKIFILLIFLFSFTAFSGTTINESELKNKQFYLNKRIAILSDLADNQLPSREVRYRRRHSISALARKRLHSPSERNIVK